MQPVALDELGAHIVRLAASVHAATYKWLLLVAEFDDRSKWPQGDLRSCAEWLRWKCGLKLGAARERLRVAHALGDLPKISQAMARGALSFAKTRALTRIATRSNEDQLLAVALRGTAEDVEKAVQELRKVSIKKKTQENQKRPSEHEPSLEAANRLVTHMWECDGSLVLRARLPAESGRLVLYALERAIKEDATARFVVRRADALVALAEHFLKSEGSAVPTAETHQVVSIVRPSVGRPQIQLPAPSVGAA